MPVPLIGTGRTLLSGGVLSPSAARAARYGLVSAWNLEEASGSALDGFGSNPLTATNNPIAGAAKVGVASRQFVAASNQSLRIADNASLSIGDVDAWWAGWVNFTTIGAGTGPGLCTKWAAGNNEFLIDYDQGTSRFRVVARNAGDTANVVLNAATFGAATTATWYFWFAYHDSATNTINISINGGAFDSAALAGGIRDSTAGFVLGGRVDDGNYLNGLLDAVAFGKPPTPIAALAAEIRDYLHNGGAGREYPSSWT